MKPAAYHYLVAHTSAFSMGLGVAGSITIILLALHDEQTWVIDSGFWVWLFASPIPSGLVVVTLGTMFIWGVLSFLSARIQGWPFRVGDEVVILTGRYKNTDTRILEVWEHNGRVRVDLGEDLECTGKDVYSAIQMCRKKPPNEASDAIPRTTHMQDAPAGEIQVADSSPCRPCSDSVDSVLQDWDDSQDGGGPPRADLGR